MGDWMPIESAPAGTWVLAWWDCSMVENMDGCSPFAIAIKNADGNWHILAPCYLDTTMAAPDFWMPLPAPPTEPTP